jgi:hypothetical protein
MLDVLLQVSLGFLLHYKTGEEAEKKEIQGK